MRDRFGIQYKNEWCSGGAKRALLNRGRIPGDHGPHTKGIRYDTSTSKTDRSRDTVPSSGNTVSDRMGQHRPKHANRPINPFWH